MCRQMAGSGHLFVIFTIEKPPFHKSVYMLNAVASVAPECDIKELTSFYEENQVALTANDFNQMQMFSSQRQELPFQLQLCESANFLSSNPRQAFLCHEGTLCGVDIGGLFARKRMRRSPSSIAWLASTPSLCRLQHSKPKLRRLPPSPSLCSGRSSPQTLCRPLLPIIHRGVVHINQVKNFYESLAL